jgi:hypothetical protein
VTQVAPHPGRRTRRSRAAAASSRPEDQRARRDAGPASIQPKLGWLAVLIEHEFEKLVVEASVVVVVPHPDLSVKMIAEGWA